MAINRPCCESAQTAASQFNSMSLLLETGDSAGRESRKRSRPEDVPVLVPTFEEAFLPLAYHLFPDGCPSVSESSNNGNGNVNGNGNAENQFPLTTVWPESKSRSIVTANEALVAIRHLRRLGKTVGFRTEEQNAMVVAACATLLITPPGEERERGVVQSSRLRDSTSLYFRELIRMTLPQSQQPISKFAVMKLISTLRRQVHNSNNSTTTSNINANCENPKQQDYSLDDMGMICILQCLTLTVRNGALSGEARRTLSSMYAVVFPLVMQAALCGDVVRLLHAITRRSHVRVYRAQRLWEFYTVCPAEQQVNYASLWLLLQLYAGFDPQGCGRFFVSSNSKKQHRQKKRQQRELKGYAGCFSFPDLSWERSFQITWQRGSNMVGVDPTAISDLNHEQRQDASEKRRQSSATVLATMDRLLDSFEGVQSFSSGFGPNKKRSFWASDLLKDTSLSHLLVVSNINTTTITPVAHDKGTSQLQLIQDVARLRVCLPFMLQQEWYHHATSAKVNNTRKDLQVRAGEDNREKLESLGEESSGSDVSNSSTEEEDSDDDDDNDNTGNDSDNSSGRIDLALDGIIPTVTLQSERSMARRRVVEALALVATQTGTIPPEAESMLDDILRAWDGTEEWGASICYDILPCVSTTTSTFPELRKKVLVYLEKLFLYGTPKLQHAIVSGTLASLLGNIAAKQWGTDLILSERPSDPSNPRQAGAISARRKMIKELIHWTDNLLLQAFLSKQHGESQLLASAAVDFFHVVCHDVSRYANSLVLPSTSLVYRLLLSKSPVSIDRVCQLLVDYKTSFQLLKQRKDKFTSSAAIEVEGLDRVAVFNCLVWDFCSILWRNSPLPSCPTTTSNNEETESSDTASKMSILFTDLDPGTLTKLNDAQLDQTVRRSLSITHGSVFAQYASDFLASRSTGQSDGDVSIDSLKGKLKQAYLDSLQKECAMKGLYAFLVTFIGSLAKREQRIKTRCE